MTARGSLFRKYAAVLILLVGGVLLLSSAVNLYLSYQETRKALVRLEHQQAQAAASRIEQLVKGIEQQVRAAMEVPFTDAAMAREQREIEFLRLLRDVPAITEVVQLDADGRVQLLVSRFEPNEISSRRDLSHDPRFLRTRIGRTYFGPVYFRNESEPYLTLAVPWGEGAPEVVAAEVNLKAIRDVISQIHVGATGYAYVIDGLGRLIAHPDTSLVLQRRDLSQLPQIQATRASSSTLDVVTETAGLRGGRVLTSHAVIEPLDWMVLAEQPIAEAFAPLRGQILLSSIFLATGLGLSVLASVILARRMVAPIRLLQQGAARIGAGELGHRIDVRTGDELEALGEEFNRAAGRLEESYATLEHKVETRTRELADANKELSESLEQQTATSEILRVISRSQTDVQPVFEAIARKAFDLCRAAHGAVYTFDGELVHLAAGHSITSEAVESFRHAYPMPPSRGGASPRSILTRAIVCIPDIHEDPEYRLNTLAQVIAYRSVLAVPLLHEGKPIGTVTVTGAEAGAFSGRQIELLKTFADQAVIAIENVRLFTELQEKNRALTAAHAQVTEALDQQTATSEILRVISSSPTDVQPVFQSILANATRLCEAHIAALFLWDGEALKVAAVTNASPKFAEYLMHTPLRPGRQTATRRAALERRPVHIRDLFADPEFSPTPTEAAIEPLVAHEIENVRTILSVPMLRESNLVGAITIWQREVRPFTDKQIELVKTFADQAAIAVENVRLFTELQEKNQALTAAHAQVTEALDQQTATSEILRVISSSPTDVQPVFEAIAESSVRLCEGRYCTVYRFDGELIHLAAHHNLDAKGRDEMRRAYPMRPSSGRSLTARAIDTRAVVHSLDYESDPAVDEATRLRARRIGYRTGIAVPMLRAGAPIGCITVTRSDAAGGPRPFMAKEIGLLQTFADQAVIAVENVRLFQELETRTRELGRSVEELQALGEVSRAVSSTLDLETVLNTIVARAVQLASANGGLIYEYDEAKAEFDHISGAHQLDADLGEVIRAQPIRLGEGAAGRAAAHRAPVQVPDVLVEGAYDVPRFLAIFERRGYRALLAVPLLLEHRILGVLVVWRQEPGTFAAEVVNLLQTFATQSVLAIHNAQLYRELEEKGRQLEAASRHKSEFLANMSHELRTPLNAILGFNEMILGEIYGDVSPSMREPLTDIQNSGKHLLGLINNVLDLSKIEAGRMELSPADYAVQDIVERVRASLHPLAAEKGLEFVASVPADIPVAYGDGGRVTQCLMNLAGNALKFTRQGRVEISVELQGENLVYHVRDTGIGIAKDKIGSLFTEFRQGDATITSEFGGTGLGLSITRKFVEMHGGRIWVESEPGKGSTFSFSVPLRLTGVKAA